jgi:hypothetical protein
MTPAEERRQVLGDATIQRMRALAEAAPPLTDEQKQAIRQSFAKTGGR